MEDKFKMHAKSGGDPMGEYEYETRMYENEHQFGKLDICFGEDDLDFSNVKKLADTYEHKFLKELWNEKNNTCI